MKSGGCPPAGPGLSCLPRAIALRPVMPRDWCASHSVKTRASSGEVTTQQDFGADSGKMAKFWDVVTKLVASRTADSASP